VVAVRVAVAWADTNKARAPVVAAATTPATVSKALP